MAPAIDEALTAPARYRRVVAPTVFVLIAAALLAAMWLIFSTVRAEREVREQAARADRVIAALGDVMDAALNAETGQRGYYITLDERYLDPYRAGRAGYADALARLRGAAPEQQARVARIETLGETKFAELEASIATVRAGRVIDARVDILSDEGKRTMDRMRGAIAEFSALERADLARARDAAASAETRLLPLLWVLLAVIVIALAAGLGLTLRIARAEAAAAHAGALREARDRADLLARELNHRVKNLFAVILALVRMSGRGDPAAQPVIEKISQRIHALVAAHAATQGVSGKERIDLRELVETAVAPYCSDSERCVIEGDALLLPVAAAMPLGLILHELVTNAVKYGAWSRAGGTVAIAWRRADGGAELSWRERGAPIEPPAGGGFGTVLIDSSTQQLGGKIEREFLSDGIAVRIAFPVEKRTADSPRRLNRS